MQPTTIGTADDPAIGQDIGQRERMGTHRPGTPPGSWPGVGVVVEFVVVKFMAPP